MVEIRVYSDRSEDGLRIKYKTGKFNRYNPREVCQKIFYYMKNRSLSDTSGHYNKEFYSSNINMKYILDILEYILKYNVKYRDIAIIVMHLCENMTYAEIGKCMDFSTNTVAGKFVSSMYDISDKLEQLSKKDIKVEDIIDQTDLYIKTYKILQRGKYFSNKDLENINYDDFIKLRGAGNYAWDDLVAYMNKRNIPYNNRSFIADELSDRITKYMTRIIQEYRIPNDIVDIYSNKIEEDINSFVTTVGDMIREARID